jgi:hypothetical protein
VSALLGLEVSILLLAVGPDRLLFISQAVRAASYLGDVLPPGTESPLLRHLHDIVEGRKPMPDSDGKRHHFIPQFLLRRFASTGSSDVPRVARLDRRSGQPRTVTTKEAAFKKNLYTLSDEDGQRHRRLEGFLSIVEHHAAPALERLEAAPLELSVADRQTIALYLALQESRTPTGNLRRQHISQWMVDLHWAAWLDSPEGFRRMYRRSIDKPASDQEIDAFREQMQERLRAGAIRYADPRAEAHGMMLKTADDLATEVYAMTWVVLLAGEGEFVLGDRCLSMVDPTPPNPWTGNAWRSSPNAETVIPLCSRAALLLTPGEPRIGRQELTAREVLGINLRSYGWAERFLFGRSQAVLTAVHRDAKRHPSRVPKPQPPRQVLMVPADPNDSTLADEYAKRGWPERVWARDEDGEMRLHDYFVVDAEGDSSRDVPIAEHVAQLARERATHITRASSSRSRSQQRGGRGRRKRR